MPKSLEKNYVRTCPSTIESIKASLETGLTAGKVYNKLKSGVDGQAAVSRAPRNLKQVENIYMSMQRKNRLSQDDIYNTLELAYQLDGFVMQFDIFPSLLLILGLREAVRDFNSFCCGSLLFLLSVFILWFIYYVSDIFCNF